MNYIKHLLLTTFAIIISISAYSQCNEIVWSDEFDGGPAVDGTKWTHDVGNGNWGWGNAELQYYRADNSTVANGVLTINTTLEGGAYYSSKIKTQGKYSLNHGRIEASIKLPAAGGIWPAFWLLPEGGGWPQNGEIDIMESKHFPTEIGGTIHYDYNGHRYTGGVHHASTAALTNEFHVYAIEWEEDEIRWYFDDILYFTASPATTVGGAWPFNNNPFYIILNVAVGGPDTWYTGRINPTASDYPTSMEVDYVRVYSGTYNMSLSGDNSVYSNEAGKTYSINDFTGATYNWTVPAGATLVSGQGTNSIVVDWGTSGGNIAVDVTAPGCDPIQYTMNVTMEAPRTVGHIFEDFEANRNVTYGQVTGTLTQNAANPGTNSVNSSAVVGQYVRNGAEQYDVCFMESADIGNANDFVTGTRVFWLDVYSTAPIGTEIILQLEDGSIATNNNWPDGRHSRLMAYTSTQNEWETLEFVYESSPDGSVGDFNVDNIVLLLDANSYTTHTVYYDNLRSMDEGLTPVSDAAFSNSEGIVLYPNPVNNILNIALENSETVYNTVEVIDISGRIIYSDKIYNNAQEYSLNMNGYNNGTYIIRLKSDTKITNKLVYKL